MSFRNTLYAFLFSVSFLVCGEVCRAQNMLQISHPQGLTNSAVLDICPAMDGVVWVGTCDGLQAYFGGRIDSARFLDGSNLDGLLVEQVVDTHDGNYWARTAYGICRWNFYTTEAKNYNEFLGSYSIAASGKGNLLVLDSSQEFYYFDHRTEAFYSLYVPQREVAEPIGFGSTDSYFWVAGKEGIYRYSWTLSEGSVPVLGKSVCISKRPVVNCVYEKGNPYITDEDNALYHLNIESGRLSYIMSLQTEIPSRGSVTGVVEFEDNLFVSFASSGVLRFTRGEEGTWIKEDLGLRVGVFRICMDNAQRLLWIATDGQGFYKYWDSRYTVSQVLSSDLKPEIGQPIRAFYKDNLNHLWVGTKGSGLVEIANPDVRNQDLSTHMYYRSNSALRDNSVFAFEDSGHQGFWIGTEGGLNYFDEKTRSLLGVDTAESVEYVHDIYQEGDSLLWVSTVGTGVYRMELRWQGNRPVAGKIQQYILDGGKFSSNFFFSMYVSRDGSMWFCNRGKGLYTLEGDHLVAYPLKSGRISPAVDDVFCMAETSDYLWVGTGNGLVGIDRSGEERYFSRENGLPSNTIHALASDSADGIWASTNEGLFRLRLSPERVARMGAERGLSVVEFSDGAFFRRDSTMYWGGVNGWIELQRNPRFEEPSYKARILYSYFSADGKFENVISRFNSANPTLRLSSRTVDFSVDFFLDDNLNRDDYDCFYSLSTDKNVKWIPLGQSTRLSFSKLRNGDHYLRILGRNRVTGAEVTSETLRIHRPPLWYETFIFKALTVLLAIGIIAAFVLMLLHYYRRRHELDLERVQRQNREELYEEKLRFFTNITHEFRTPLSLIYTPSEQILAYDKSDGTIRRYAQQIHTNAERLNNLIQEVIDYRRIETHHQNIHLERMDVSALALSNVSDFGELARTSGLELVHDIRPGIIWNMDGKCFTRILTNLISNALKYTKEGGTVKVSLDVVDGKLRLSVYNTGKGIAKEDFDKVFSRYGILSDVEESRVSTLTSRNGLGLSICKGVAELLGGTIEIDSVVGEYAQFNVLLPEMALEETPGVDVDTRTDIIPDKVVAVQDEAPVRENLGLPPILVVDDNKDFLALLTDSLPEYDVQTAEDASVAMEKLKKEPPLLIVTDIMMPGMDGLEFTQSVKKNKHTMHIPVVVLSAKNSVEERVAGINAGADAYIGKPFSIKELKATIEQLLQKTDTMKEYYNSSASAFDYMDGKLVSQEDKEFLDAVNDYLEKAIPSGDLNVDQMAQALFLSTRNLYRRFKALDLLPPNEYIREKKLDRAAKLLRTSSLTIQEVIYECGFNNRAHFYKEFGRRFGMTPKEYRSENRKKDESLS